MEDAMADAIMGKDAEDRILLGTAWAATALAIAFTIWRLFAVEPQREDPAAPGASDPQPASESTTPKADRSAPSVLQIFLFSLTPQGGGGGNNEATPVAAPPLGFVPQEAKIVGSNFYRMLNEIYYRGNAPAWIGATFTVTGMLFRDVPSIGSNRAVIGRYVVTCCAADASVAGFLVEGPQTGGPKQESWVTCRGVLQWRMVAQGRLPVVILYELKSASAESPFHESTFSP
jgi:uncharacterized repeat protein (TIGR03943 family)